MPGNQPPAYPIGCRFFRKVPDVRFRPALWLAATLTLTIAVPAHAKLSRGEARMIQTVDAEQQRTTDFLAKIVNQNSGTMNLAGVDAVRRMDSPSDVR